MISQQTIDIVKSTAPVLKKNGQQITTRMYEIMFRNHPEIREQFNMSAQANGSQPARLATAVYSYANQIDNLRALMPMVEKIAYRHVQTHRYTRTISYCRRKFTASNERCFGRSSYRRSDGSLE